MKHIVMFFLLSLATLFTYCQNLKVGDYAPPVKIEAVINPGIRDNFYKDKFLVLDFWATWCAPCIAGFPHLNKLQNRIKNDSIVFAIMTYENEKTIRRFFSY